jgi:hypothetical protein
LASDATPARPVDAAATAAPLAHAAGAARR